MSLHLTRIPQDDDELYELVWALWGVRIPRVPVCPNHSTPFDAFAEAFFGRAPVSVWKASRGFGGKSRTLAYLTLTEAVVLGVDVNILGGSGAQSQNVHESMMEGWDSKLAPRYMIDSETTIFTRLSNGAKVKALMASQRSVRGPHPQRLRLDEIDEMNIEILDAAMGQPMPGKGFDTQTVMSSTHQYADKTMSKILERAEDKDWPVHEWCWRETSNPVDGWLRESTIERKRHEVTKHMWEVEYDLQEPSFGVRAIDTDAVEAMFSGWCVCDDGPHGPDECTGMKTYKHQDKKKSEQWVFEEPDKRHGEYVTAADWAKEVDKTVIATFRVDCTPWRLVAYSRTFRKPWPMMIDLFDSRVKDYPGHAIHDGTGIGNVIHDLIKVRAKSFVMSGRARDDMLTEYVAAVEKGQIVAPKVESAYTEHKYASIEDLYARGKDYHLPDTISAMALAWNARHLHPKRVKPMMDITVDVSPWKDY